MPAATMRAWQAVLRRLVMPAAAISLAAGLGSAVPAPHAVADAAGLAGSSGSLAGPGTPVTAYVISPISGTVTPIATATNTAGPPITVDGAGGEPGYIAITPDGTTAYVVNDTSSSSGTVTPITTATNTAGPPITTGNAP
jgi:DNA-binding beta-propeller fold protein YncE